MREARLIADALVAKINAVQAVQDASATARRTWVAFDRKEDYAFLVVHVIPQAMSAERATRARIDQEHSITISVGKAAATLADQDELIDITADILDALAGESLQAAGANIIDFRRIEETPVVDHEFFSKTQVLRTLARITYTWRPG